MIDGKERRKEGRIVEYIEGMRTGQQNSVAKINDQLVLTTAEAAYCNILVADATD
jgi:predicted transcriptional regulator